MAPPEVMAARRAPLRPFALLLFRFPGRKAPPPPPTGGEAAGGDAGGGRGGADPEPEAPRADVEPRLERGGRYDGARFALFEAVLGVEPELARKVAGVRNPPLLAEPFAKMVRNLLRQPPRID